MAFNKNYFSPIGGQSTRGGAPQVFSYATTDSQATLEATGYFNLAKTYLEINDIIIIIYANGYNEYKVTASPLNGDIEIQNTQSITGTSVVSKSADYTASVNDNVILCNAASGLITISLHSAIGSGGQEITIKKIDNTNNLVTLDGFGSETIDGDLTFSLELEDEAVTVISDNSNWYII